MDCLLSNDKFCSRQYAGGKQATASPEKALKIQEKMANVENYQAFMPDITDLPESLTAQTFTEQYQSIHSVRYQKVLEQANLLYRA
jgi:hypothetical protein